MVKTDNIWSCYNITMKNLISQDPNILSGKPIITGTRMSVETVLELISSGMNSKDIIKEYPYLTEEQIRAAVGYAKKLVGQEESYIFDKAHIVTTHEISR